MNWANNSYTKKKLRRIAKNIFGTGETSKISQRELIEKHGIAYAIALEMKHYSHQQAQLQRKAETNSARGK